MAKPVLPFIIFKEGWNCLEVFEFAHAIIEEHQWSHLIHWSDKQSYDGDERQGGEVPALVPFGSDG